MRTQEPLQSENRPMLSLQQMKAMKESLSQLVNYIIVELMAKADNKKVQLFMYSLARAVVQIDSIFTLYEKGYGSDSLILFRTQIERLLTLHYVIDNDSINEYDDYSFVQNFEARNNVKSDSKRNETLNQEFWRESKSRIERYQRLKKKGKFWERPKAYQLEEISKNHGIHELYKYGYNNASGEVHPLASDGFEELSLVSGIKPKNHQELDSRPIINNALVVFLAIVDLAIDEMGYGWRMEVFNFLKSYQQSIREGISKYEMDNQALWDLISNRVPIYCKDNCEESRIQ
jgi:hypothetical protein